MYANGSKTAKFKRDTTKNAELEASETITTRWTDEEVEAF